MRSLKLSGMVAAAILSLPAVANASEADLQKQIDELKIRLEATTEVIEASSGKSKTQIGGYGEMHYNNLSGEGGASDKKELDFHRFVMFFSHEFSDSIRFFSELEVEHSIAGDGKVGEVELEQAYIEFDLNKNHTAKGGLFLVPVGILNETHEPPTFYGVERNPVEKNIVPATWWEGGAGVSGEMAKGWRYDVALTSGLDLGTSGTTKVRSGRQKVGKAKVDSLMTSARIKWIGVPGLEVAATLTYQDDYTQGAGTKNSAQLIETHAIWKTGPYALRALYASWDVEGQTDGYDKQSGFYIEPSYKVNEKIGVFARYNQYDNQAGDSSKNGEKEQIDVGINYMPHPDVVIKADYQSQDNASNKNQNGFNIGIGYQF
ncbi:inverse autotransporter beta domain-containing protein [Beggiatoa alba]|nr:inverse autotransporter beta domain-containing protein [Beggiatoa alba]